MYAKYSSTLDIFSQNLNIDSYDYSNPFQIDFIIKKTSPE